MEVIVFEGPAGSGKSTAINSLLEIIPGSALYTHPYNRPRNYMMPGIAVLQKDLDQLLHILAYRDSTLILDRFWISAWAYNFLRHEDIWPFNSHMDQLVDIFDRLYQYLSQQGEILQDTIQLKYYFIIPEIEELKKRRRESGKEYPFDAEEEIGVYNGIVSSMENYTAISVQNLEISHYVRRPSA